MTPKTQSRPIRFNKPTHAALASRRQTPVLVKTLRQQVGLSRKQFARLIAASERAVADWESNRPVSPVVQKSLREIERLIRALAGVMNPNSIGDWLEQPNDAFSGLKPLELIERGEMDRLWRMIFEVESGALN